MLYGAHYETFAMPDEPLRCDSCGARVAQLEPCTWDEDLMVGECCRVHSDDLPEEPICPMVAEIAESAGSVRQFAELLRAHQPATCVHCAEGRKTVVSDRLVMGSRDAVCCEANQEKGLA